MSSSPTPVWIDTVDTDTASTDDWTALMLACQEGHVDIVNALLDHHRAGVNTINTNGSTALMLACQEGHVDIVNALLDHHRAGVNTINTNGSTALMLACQEGHVDIVNALLDHHRAGVNTINTNGSTALMLACQEGHVDIVNALLDHHRAGVNTINTNGSTALMLACFKGHVDIVSALLACGADTDTTNNTGYSALKAASEKGHVDTVRALLTHGADVNTTDTNGWTALMRACYNGHVDIANALLSHGADINITQNGYTALIAASQNIHVDVVHLLLARGADVNTTSNGCAALVKACSNGCDDIVNALLAHGADVNVTDYDGSTALMCACRNGYDDIVTALLARGADVNTVNTDGYTALMRACYYEHVDIVNALLDRLADVNMAVPNDNVTDGGWTASHFNAFNGNVPILELLLSHGATFSRDGDGDTPLLIAACERHDDYVDRWLGVPDMSRSDKADALEVLGARHWVTDRGTCPEQWQRAMEERHRAGRPAVLKKTATEVAVFDDATEVQTPEDLRQLQQWSDRQALGTQAVLIADRVLGKVHRVTEQVISVNAEIYADNDRYDRAMELLLYSLANLSARCPFTGNSPSIGCYAQAVDIQVRGQRAGSRGHWRFCHGLAFLRRAVSAVTRAEAARSGSERIRVLRRRQHLLRILLHAVSLLQGTLGEASPAERRDYLQEVKELVGRDFRGQGGETLLHLACDARTEDFYEWKGVFRGRPFPSPEVVQALLDAGCDAGATNTDGLTALQVAGDHSGIVGLLSVD